MSHIAIIGAGWLGTPLAKELSNHHDVIATRTSEQGVRELAGLGIRGMVCKLGTPCPELKATLGHIDTLVGCFPPGFRQGKGDEYAREWHELVRMARESGVKKIVMVSSTSVYPNEARLMKEDDASLGLAVTHYSFSDKARVLLKAEQYVKDSGLDYAIVRCSGLFGPGRDPARFALRLSQVSRRAPANMLHLSDAVGAVAFAVEQISGEVVNATTPETVSKAEFYQAALDAAHSEVILKDIVDTEDKRICSDKLTHLGYPFYFTSTLEALQPSEDSSL